MSAIDRDSCDSDKWGNWESDKVCKICGHKIINSEVGSSRLDDGTYMCPACQHDEEKRARE